MSVESLVAVARQRLASSSVMPPLRSLQEHGALLRAMTVLHELLSSSSSSSPELLQVTRVVRRAGRRLEDALDGERARPLTLFVSGCVEPDIVPLADAIAGLLTTANQPGGDPGLAIIGEALAVVVEAELGSALAVSCGLPSFEVPRPWRTPFQPQRHQLLERAEGPRDVVIAVERCARIGRGGRLLEPALVIVGGGA